MCDGWKVKNKIACDECGYPQSEAKYPSLREYNKHNSKIFECEVCHCPIAEEDNYVATNHKYCCEACSDNIVFEEEEDCWIGEQPPPEEEFKKMWNLAVSDGDTRSFEDFCIDWL